MSEQSDWIRTRGFSIVSGPYMRGYAPGFDRHKRYQFMRETWDEPAVFALSEQSAYFNVAGLYYRDLPTESTAS